MYIVQIIFFLGGSWEFGIPFWLYDSVQGEEFIVKFRLNISYPSWCDIFLGVRCIVSRFLSEGIAIYLRSKEIQDLLLLSLGLEASVPTWSMLLSPLGLGCSGILELCECSVEATRCPRVCRLLHLRCILSMHGDWLQTWSWQLYLLQVVSCISLVTVITWVLGGTKCIIWVLHTLLSSPVVYASAGMLISLDWFWTWEFKVPWWLC